MLLYVKYCCQIDKYILKVTDSSLEKVLNSSPKIHPGKYLNGLMEFSAVSTAHHILVFGGFTQTDKEVLWEHIQRFRIPT